MFKYNMQKFTGQRIISTAILVIAVGFFFLLASKADAFATYTKTFQYGTDSTLVERYPNNEYGDEDSCYVDGSKGSYRERSTLMRWSIDGLPNGSTITKATIYLQVNNPSVNTFYLYELKKKWVESQANWNRASRTVSWTKEGANSSRDRDSSRAGSLYAWKTGTVKVELDRKMVQDWLDYPTRNYGVIMANRAATDYIMFYCSETKYTSRRPKLVIEYKR